ncbi:helix-turn-helix transcriptional regulator [Photobacterium makurazakiensis]|uniref:AraC family transcriptional regulator n=1 Tax=Photobacterium makurazakiensis TaxID=2910234 RepID=UPI003D1490E6
MEQKFEGVDNVSPEEHERREAFIKALNKDVVALMWDYSNNYLLDWHKHEYVQLLYPSTGVITVRTDNAAAVLTPRQALLIPAGVSHKVKMNGKVEMRSLFMRNKETDSLSLVTVTPMLREMLRHAVKINQSYCEGSAEERLMEVLLDQIDIVHGLQLSLPRPSDAGIRWIEKELLANPQNDKTFEEWAEFLCTSSRTLRRRFQQDINQPFRYWRTQIRLSVALEKLATGQSVSQTALEVGFSSESAFIATFRKEFGITPKRYSVEVSPHKHIR